MCTLTIINVIIIQHIFSPRLCGDCDSRLSRCWLNQAIEEEGGTVGSPCFYLPLFRGNVRPPDHRFICVRRASGFIGTDGGDVGDETVSMTLEEAMDALESSGIEVGGCGSLKEVQSRT